MAQAFLKKEQGRSLKKGGLWIYDNEIDRVEGAFQNGDLVQVVDFDGFVMGTGFLNTVSRIAVRMLTRNPNQEIDVDFLKQRVREAWEYRKKTVDTGCCRLLFGEADFLPGFIADKFSDVIVIQSTALGIDRMKDTIARLIREVLSEDGIAVRGIYERSDVKVRLSEGMEKVKGYLSKPFDTKVEICENGIRYLVDVENGQKTGYFLDQKYNRLAIQRLCRNASVLDCFTHTGSFALNAVSGGAERVLGVDASESAILQAAENAALNGWEDRVEFKCADVFELLPELYKAGERYDVVILDPPAFTKSRSSVKGAVKGYREINLRGIKLVKDGGFLATCSCSHFMAPDLFAEIIRQAAAAAHRRIRQVQFGTQAPDHPVLWPLEDSYYLKFYIFQVCDER